MLSISEQRRPPPYLLLPGLANEFRGQLLYKERQNSRVLSDSVDVQQPGTELDQNEEKVDVGRRSVGVGVRIWPADSKQNAFSVVKSQTSY